MSLQRKHKLTMPQLLWGGLSENWILKEFGDMHWEQITSALNTPSDELVDSRGERLYASFVRLRWSGENISHFTENHHLKFDSSLSRYGSKMFFSETFVEGEAGKITANLMSVFSTRSKSDNTKLKKGTLKADIDSDTVKLHEKLPAVAKEYLEHKSTILDKSNQLLPEGILDYLYQKEYTIDAYDDINGVGLLYFASSPKINEKCEREYIKTHYEIDGDWLEVAGVTSRDIHYYGNANSGDKLIYELNSLEQNGDQLEIRSSLYRANNGRLIARISTTKVLRKDAKFEKLEVPTTCKESLIKEVVSTNLNPKKSEKSKALTDLDQDTLNTIVIDFLSTVLEVDGLTPDTQLKALGVESIVYQELSELLFEKHNIDANPSRFYGAATINALTDYLLGKDNVPVARKYLDTTKQEEIAVVGISCQFPGSANKEAYWNHLKDNKDLISEVQQDRWDWKSFNKDPEKTSRSKWGGFIEGVGNFDPLFFGISPFEATLMDPQQRLTLEAVYTALEDANIVPSTLKGSNTGVYIGVSGSDYAHIARDARKDIVQAYDAIGTASSILANRISYLLDIHGPNQAIDTACSSSLVAVDQAVKSLQNGISDMAIAGGVHIMLRPELTISYHEAGMLSVDGKCKTFDDSANGYVRGEGVGMVVLKPLKKAQEDGDFIYGVIKGTSVNHGGNANTLTSPNPQAQKALLVEAYSNANVTPDQVSYIEAHGTGTPLGDPIEIEGLKLAFEELNEESSPSKINYCGIGSVKTNIGHLEAAAGIAGLIKVLLCMKNQTLPGNPNLKTQNKYIDLVNSPFYLRKQTSAWEVDHQKRIAGVSSFGFGGVNAHVVLEDYKNPFNVYKSTDEAIIVLSAKNADRLKEKAHDLRVFLEANPKTALHDLAYTLQYGREEMDERLAFNAKNLQEVISRLEAYEKGNLPSMYIGNSRKENFETLLQGDAGKAYMDIVINQKEYNLVAQLWVKGVDFDWSFLYGNIAPNKIALPTYPFAKQHYWVETMEAKETSASEVVVMEETTETSLEIPVEEKIESFLMSVLKKVLKLDEKDIDFSADIADYGIDSIMSSIMISDIREIVPDVPPLLFMEHKTFYDVIDQLATEFASDFTGIQTSKPTSEKPKAIAQIKEEVKAPEVRIETTETSKTESKPKNTDVAIVGIHGMLPQSSSVSQFFQHIENGDILTELFPEKRSELLGLSEEERKQLDSFYGAFIDNIEYFDYKRFKFSEEEAIQIDPQLRKLIETVWYAIGDSGYKVKDFSKNETGVFVATRGNSGYLEVMQKNNLPYETESPTLYANRLSHVFNLKGPSEVVDTACSSFIAAIQRAFHAFERGDCTQAIVATATLNLSAYELTKEDLTGIYSKNGTTKSFSEDADGFARSETIGAIIVKPLEQAEKDGDYIYGVVKGVGVYHGGKSPLKWNSPNIKGQKKAIEKAIQTANIDPATVAYIEAEANGVSFVDTSEMVSIQSVYKNALQNGSDNKTFYIGSLKPLMGHAEASSTFPCLLKLLASIKKEKLFGVKGLEEINKGITIQDHFEILKEDIAWNSNGTPKRVAMNCLGIGGVNTHMILEEYQNTTETSKVNEFVFLFSDVNETNLKTQLQGVLNSLKEFEYSLPELALLNRLEFTLQEGRIYESERLAIKANTLSELTSSIESWLSNPENWNNNETQFFHLETTSIDKEEINRAEERKDWTALASYWVQGATINWKNTRTGATPKRLPVSTTSLTKTFCWPHTINVIEETTTMKKQRSLYEKVAGQTESPYTFENKHLFLFDLKWKQSFVQSNGVPTDFSQHVVLGYVNNELPENTAGLKIESPTQHDENSFTELVNTIFLYIKDIIKQKPKSPVAIQLILPKSAIHTAYGLSGMIHTVRQESTKLKTQLIFVDDNIGQEELQTILNENLAQIHEDRIIQYENGIRLVEVAHPTHVLDAPINTLETYKEDDVILITGGLGGLGLVCAENIIENTNKATLILLGRSELNEQKQAQLDKLNKGAHNVVYHSVDISSEKEVELLINHTVETYTKLDGIIHCAGVIRDSYIMKKTTEQIEQVFQPKVHGVNYLDRYTKDIELRFFLCFSSLHSLGNPGQVDYAMSNAYLDGFTRARNEQVAAGNRFGKSIALNWPYWESGGMQLSEIAIELMTSTKGSVPMPTQVGMEIMHYALQKGIEQIFVDMGDYDKITKQHRIELPKEESLGIQ
jgi:probable biosynthetic protein (TIGR04098 family)